MRTKEIEIWIESDFDHELKSNEYMFSMTKYPRTKKAKLIIEIPEKKIEITESDLWRAFRKTNKEFAIPHPPHYSWLKEFFKKLGFKDEQKHTRKI